jgi:hypothetical protein
MEGMQTTIIIAAFIMGVVAGVLFSTLDESILGLVVLDSSGLESISSPSDYLNESSFLLYNDRLTIKVNNASIASYGDTGSMLPFLTNTSNGIIIRPASESEIHVGDIISFRKDDQVIAHRVVQISSDEDGTLFTTKGDNVNSVDESVRFNEIDYKLVGILY